MHEGYDSRYSSQYNVRLLLLDTVAELSEDLPSDQVTVKRICEQANMSRTMFYRYFSDKVDIINWYVGDCMDMGANQIGIKYSWFEGHLITTRRIEPYRSFFNWCINSKERGEIAENFYDTRRRALHVALEKRGVPLSERLAFEIEACIGAEFKATEKWFEGHYDVSVKAMCNYLVSAVPSDLFNLLDKPIDPAFGRS